MRDKRVLAIVLAGGEGKRLMPLTADRAKPAVPFGGTYRLIDFALSNIVNSGGLRIVVLTQYKSHSLDRHITMTWRMSTMLGNYVAPVPAQQRVSKEWYEGSADAIFQSLNLVADERPKYVLVAGADNVYRMNFAQMLDQHIETGAPCTVAGIRQPVSLSDQFGVIEVDEETRPKISRFVEKPEHTDGLPDSPDEFLASMGNYMFTTEALVEAVTRDSQDDSSNHDMGGDIVPAFVDRGECYVYDFTKNDVPGSTDRDRDYWRDVGTLDTFYDANMDLISVSPDFNLYNQDWQLLTNTPPLPPAKFVHGWHGRIGHAVNSIVSPGVVISGATVENSVLSPNCRVHSWATVSDSVLFNNVTVSRHAVVRRAIIDKNVHIPEGVRIGIDPEEDRARGFVITDAGLVVVGKGQTVDPR